MVFILNPELLGVLDKIEKADLLKDTELASLRALVDDCRLLDMYGVNVHQMAEKKRAESRASLTAAIEDTLYLFSGRSISNHLAGVPKLVENRKKARVTNEYHVYYSIAYIVAVTGCSVYKAQQEYAYRNNRTPESVKRQYLAQKKKLGIK